jgi:uncharacterized membrane protein (UPF0127 family)
MADGDRYTLRVGKGSRTTFTVECVISEPARKRGLSGRASLPAGHGMLFIFDHVSRQGMWMIEMKFPLDIVWLDEQMTIVHISASCPPCESAAKCPTYSSRYRVKYAIEMTAGQAAANGFVVGKQLSVV